MSLALPPTAAVTVRAPAKVNLELRVGPERDDGFHALSTVYMAVGLHDEVTVEPADDWSVSVTGAQAALVPTGESNLALRAARAVAAELGIEDALQVRIRKEIPVAGGMAGGSADAAAALLACDGLWSAGLGRDELGALAARLGSDVPFCLAGGIAMGSGRGEQLAPVLARGGRYHWVFALAEDGLSTPAVYAECDRLRDGQEVPDAVPSPEMMAALRSGDAEALGAALNNDLQPAAFSLQPGLSDVVEAGLEFGALGGLVSGSGPTVAFLTGSAEGALDLAVSLTASGVASDVRRATGPVAGAHVVPGEHVGPAPARA